MGFDTKSRCKTALKHLRSPFPAIYHHIKSYKGLWKKIIFCDFCDFWFFSLFWGFLRFSKKYRKSCKKGWKIILKFFMAFLDLLISSNHCICHGNTIKSIFTKIKKIQFSAFFAILADFQDFCVKWRKNEFF